MGFRVYTVPEAATILKKGGAMINAFNFTFDQAISFQTNLMLTQMKLEEVFTDMARNEGHKTVIITDRGLMDSQAYVSADVWQTILHKQGWNNVSLRDKRYDAIIHMVTAADGASDFY